MNNITRHLVYPSVVLALACVSADAEPVPAYTESGMTDHSAFTSPDPLPNIGDVTRGVLAVDDGFTADPSADDSSPADVVAGEATTDSSDPSPSTDGSGSDPAVSGFSNAQATSGFNGTAVTAIPEPSSLFLVGSMFIGLGMHRRKQRAAR